MKRLRKLGSILTTLALCLTLLPTSALAAGGGTIEIGSAEQLAAIGIDTANYPLDGNYILTADIDLEGSADNPWTPIGSYETPFTGTFDGQGHTIRGLYITGNFDDTGLFGRVGALRGSTSSVKNLTLYGTVTSTYGGNTTSNWNINIGGLAGTMSGSIQNCAVHVDISHTTAFTSGFTGYIGGLVGNFMDGTIENCYSTGQISGSSSGEAFPMARYDIGGIAGTSSTGNAITNCYNTGAVTGNLTNNSSSAKTYVYTGGVVGNNSGELSKCYNIGAVSGTDNGSSSSKSGSVVGGASGSVTNCYYRTGTAAEGIGSGSGDAKEKSDLTDIPIGEDGLPAEDWMMSTSLGQPILIANPEGAVEIGDGLTEDTAFQILDLDALVYYRDLINTGAKYTIGEETYPYASAYYELTTDIDMNPGYTYNPKTGMWSSTPTNNWTPIGNYNSSASSSATYFSGTFNGNGKVISNLYVNGDYNYAGLFGYIRGGTVQNLTVTGSVSISGRTAGGVVGFNAGGTISNCDADVAVTVKSTDSPGDAGSIVGSNSGTVTGCTSSGNVKAESNEDTTAYAGGVAGANSTDSGSITGCSNEGSVIADGKSAYVGGVVGDSNGYEGEGDVINCFNTASVTGNGKSAHVGGVMGVNSASGISNCYNTGTITGNGNGAYVGGVVGRLMDDTVTNCYYLAASESADAETGAGKTQAQFASGEVAWLLQDWWDTNAPDSEKGQVLGQKIGEDGAPVLSGDRGRRVYQLIFQAAGTEEIVLYGNSGALRFPADPTPPAGLAFTGWFSGGTKLTETSVISADIVATAQFGTIQEPEPEPEPPSGGSSGGSSSRPDPEPSEPPVDVSTGTTTQGGRTPLRPPPGPPRRGGERRGQRRRLRQRGPGDRPVGPGEQQYLRGHRPGDLRGRDQRPGVPPRLHRGEPWKRDQRQPHHFHPGGVGDHSQRRPHRFGQREGQHHRLRPGHRQYRHPGGDLRRTGSGGNHRRPYPHGTGGGRHPRHRGGAGKRRRHPGSHPQIGGRGKRCDHSTERLRHRGARGQQQNL